MHSHDLVILTCASTVTWADWVDLSKGIADSIRMRPRVLARLHGMGDFTSDAPALHALHRAATSREFNNALASPSCDCCGHSPSEEESKMAPFRNRDRSNRSGRGQVEHNVLEGLPITQYREVEITIGPNTTESKQLDQDDWPVLPMPRDSHLLPEHSQQILARARASRIYKLPAPVEEDKEIVDEEEEHKEVRQGFAVKKWMKVPRHLEESEPEYLAKRRKGLPSQYVNGASVIQPTPTREAKVKKTDAEGNVGQATDAVTDAAISAPGTVVEGLGVVNAQGVVVANDLLRQTPPRRRPPPPKKKKRSGPGRGKKKVLFAEGTTEQGTPVSSTGSELLTVPVVKQEGSVEPSEGGDTPMPDAGDEDERSGEEGSDDDDHEDHEGHDGHEETPVQAMPTSTASAQTMNVPDVEQTDTRMADASPIAEAAPIAATKPNQPIQALAPSVDTTAIERSEPSLQPSVQQQSAEAPRRDPSSSPELPLSTVSHSRQNSLNQLPSISTPETSTVPEHVVPLESSAAPEPSDPEAAPGKAPEAALEAAPGAAPEMTRTEELVAPSTADKEVLLATNVELSTDTAPTPDDEPDLLGSLERQLEMDSETMGAN
ncbi:hypothetical protein PMIN06_006915 [Paraphaeosphaeria minitans]|uniref:Uncharacterized protein n=1 Tax=Paraphaeosphaeria minitans TaxID=565426 RepID=A0A9P6KQ74_9PLEO|nr:hypothetical protein PMIN01_06878 [Paraphaeosphaeria minitans]